MNRQMVSKQIAKRKIKIEKCDYRDFEFKISTDDLRIKMQHRIWVWVCWVIVIWCYVDCEIEAFVQLNEFRIIKTTIINTMINSVNDNKKMKGNKVFMNLMEKEAVY